jgi:uncharacterized SAM-binding protein YcdF (DUF218 family)
MPPEILSAALVLWDYHQLGHQPAPADGILVFGSNDLRVAAHAAELYHSGLAPWILFSGARGRMTEHWPETEAVAMARVARETGVPATCIRVEDQATHTGENIRFSRDLLAASGVTISTAIVVQKPYMERRTIAALDVQWPDAEFLASSPRLGFLQYITPELPPELVIPAMVGDFRRILEYPALGFASAQEVPAEVLAAFQRLVAAGFGERLV